MSWNARAVFLATRVSPAQAGHALTEGYHGDAFADRRHPHAYIHDLVAAVNVNATRTIPLSLFIGRGFVSYGTDDPMDRPFACFFNPHG